MTEQISLTVNGIQQTLETKPGETLASLLRLRLRLTGSIKVVNSIGIPHLIDIIEKLNQRNSKLVFTNLDPTIEKTFNIMGIFQFAEKADSVESAFE